MKISIVTIYKSSKIDSFSKKSSWSGTVYNMAKTLRKRGINVEHIEKLNNKFKVFLKIKKFYYLLFFKKGYLINREPFVLKSYSRQIIKSLKKSNSDVILSPSTLPIAYLKTQKPIILWIDATFAGINDFYPSFSNLCEETKKNGNIIEQLAFNKCSLVIFTSNWAAKTVFENYKIDPKKIKIIPFGGNVNHNNEISDINKIFKLKSFKKCKLLFIGTDWENKGGPMALNVTKQLNRMGMESELHIVGCRPKLQDYKYVKVHGFRKITTEYERCYMDKLFKFSHFLIVPSQSECYGLVFTEASSFGLPSITTNVGGIPSVVTNGVNGYKFELTDSIEKYCDCIIKLMLSKIEYKNLSFSSFKEYENKLSWNKSSKSLENLLKTVLTNKNHAK